MTDTKTLKGIIAKNYDLYLVEANYSEDEIKNRINEKEYSGEFINEYRTMDTHLSVEETTGWLLENMGNKGKFEFIHQHKNKEKGEGES